VSREEPGGAPGDPRETNLGYWCRGPVRERPEGTAIVDLSRDPPREVSYAELDARTERAASLLSGAGCRPGDRLAMAVGNRFEFVEIMYGAMRAGVVPVPLNTRLAPATLAYVVEDAGCVGAVVEPGACPPAAGIAERLGLEIRFVVGGDPGPGWTAYEAALAGAAPAFEPPALEPDHPAFQPYTSGSTGRPKGVVLTHEGQLWWVRCLEKYWPSSPEERALAAVPLYHKNAMAGAIKPMLQAGGSVVLLPDFEPRRFLRALAEHRCTRVGAVPAVFTLLLRNRDLIDALDFSALASISIGSAPVPEELWAEVEEAFGAEVRESYGLTEGGPVMIGPPLDGRPVPRGSCGVAWPEGEVKLVDADGNEHPTDGELWVKNPGVTPGYHGLPEVNRERLRDGWLRTGDLFHRDAQGFFYFRGRADDMFNCGGENIYPKEVENLLLAHPHVADAAVVPLPHAVKGHAPVAMVVPVPGADVNADDLKRWTLEEGPAYAHPRRIAVVDGLPLTGAGKTDREAVRAALGDRFGAELGGEG